MRYAIVFSFLVLVTGCGHNKGTETHNDVITTVDKLGTKVQFFSLPAFNGKTNVGYGTVLNDIVSHQAPGDSNHYDDLVTLGHETCHGIHSYIRNKMGKGTGQANGFYVLNDQAVVIEEPPIRKSNVAKYIPSILRGKRYNLYVVGQKEWDDTPLYIWDEWNAYINGGATGVDLVQKNLWTAGWRDAVAGPIEFTVYAIAIAHAVKEIAPDYYATNTQFKEFLAFNTRRAMKVFKEGRVMKQFMYDEQDAYYEKLMKSPEAEEFRVKTREMFGHHFTEEVLGF